MAVILNYDGKQYRLPEGVTEEQGIQALQEQALANMEPEPVAPAPQGPPDSFLDNTLDVVGEFANSANRGVAETLDFLGPGTINAALRWGESEYQLPTFGGGLAATPGGEGNFMDPGLGRELVQAAGETVPAAASFATVPGRNVATAPGALAELTGFGSAAPITGISDEAAGIVSQADAFGWPLSPGDRLDSPGLKRLESSIESMPMVANPMGRMSQQRQAIVNQAAAESLGVPGKTRLTQETMGSVADDLSGEFKRLDMEEDLIVTQQFDDELANIEQTARTRIFADPEQVSTTIDGVMDKIGESGRLSAVDYQDISSEFKKKIRQVYEGNSGAKDPQFGDTLRDLVSALDDLAEDNLDGAALARLREARRRWRTLTQLEGSRAVRESGDVSGPLLGNYLRRTDKSGYGRGKNTSDMYQAARMSKAFPSAPDSGTASRMFLQNAASHPLVTALLGGGGLGAATTNLPAAVAAIAGGAVLPPLLANAYHYGMPLARKGLPPLAPRAGLQANVVSGWFEE